MGLNLLVFAAINFIILAQCGELVDLSGKIYQTSAALEKENHMYCYECNTMVNGNSCSNFTDKDDYTKFSTKCTGDRKTCMVKRYSYTTSNESGTSIQQLWSLERNCSVKCEPGCIIIGERNKIYACQDYCESPLCNITNGANSIVIPYNFFIIFFSLLNLLPRNFSSRITNKLNEFKLFIFGQQ